MRYLIMFVVLAALSFNEAPLASALLVAQTSAQEKAASLRAQLSDIETKQAELQTRLQNLEEQLQPANIEKYLAGVGSTKPEDLREQRRRQLEIERNGVQKQLDLLSASHIRLATALAQAEADAYRQSAAPAPPTIATPTSAAVAGPSSEPPNEVTTPARTRRGRKKKIRKTRRAHHVTQTVSSRTVRSLPD